MENDMDKETLESMLIEYIDGSLNPADKARIELELSKNEEAYRTYEQLREVINVMNQSESLEPGPSLKLSFEKLLQEEIKTGKRSARIVFFQPAVYRMAAALVLIMAGIGIGYRINMNQQQRADEVASLKKEVEATKLMMLSMMDNQLSANQRIQGVNVALKIGKADDDVVNALVRTLNEDPNTNVRLAALDALAKFHEEPHVRKVLIQSLSQQKDPVVQIELIQLMVRMKEKGAVKDLEIIIDNAETMKAVKDEAYSGLLKLS